MQWRAHSLLTPHRSSPTHLGADVALPPYLSRPSPLHAFIIPSPLVVHPVHPSVPSYHLPPDRYALKGNPLPRFTHGTVSPPQATRARIHGEAAGVNHIECPTQFSLRVVVGRFAVDLRQLLQPRVQPAHVARCLLDLHQQCSCHFPSGRRATSHAGGIADWVRRGVSVERVEGDTHLLRNLAPLSAVMGEASVGWLLWWHGGPWGRAQAATGCTRSKARLPLASSPTAVAARVSRLAGASSTLGEGRHDRTVCRQTPPRSR